MKLFNSNNISRLFALDVSITDSSLTYKTYSAYDIASLKSIWQAIANDPDHLTNVRYYKTPTPDMTPVWTTDKYAVYDFVAPGTSMPVGTINFEDIANSSNFSDRAAYGVMMPRYYEQTQTPMTPKVDTHHRFTQGLVNLVAQTSASKTNALENLFLTGDGAMISIVIPFADSTHDQWEMIFSTADSGLLRVSSGQQVTKLPTDHLADYVASEMPQVLFTNKTATVTADGYIDLSFHLASATGVAVTDHNATVYLKTTGGYLNKQQVTTTNGVGKVRFVASHLTAGDTIKVSCGFKFYSGTDDCVITVQ